MPNALVASNGMQEMRIPVNDLKRHFEATRGIIAPAIERVLESGWYVLGGEGQAFEAEFASYCGASACVGLASGTDALELALRAVGITAGSRVATVANAGFYTSTVLLAIGAVPVFVDVERETHLMDPNALAEVVAQGIDAVVVTHLYGRLCNMEVLRSIVSPHNIPLIEDCAQAHGAILALDELQAAVLLAKLPHLERWNARRREIATRYSKGLRNPKIHSPAIVGNENVAHLYVIVCEDRDSLRTHLAAAGVTSEIHFPVPDYRQAVLATDRSWPVLPVTEWLSERVVTLPCFPELTDHEVDFVISRVNEWQPCIP